MTGGDLQRIGDERTVSHTIQSHFCYDIVDVAQAQQGDGQPARCVALCATLQGSGISEMVGKKRSSCIEFSGGIFCVLGKGKPPDSVLSD